jgi:PTS system ascorbate-specific IIA component
MTALLIVAHAPLASALAATAAHIDVGEVQLEAVDVGPDATAEQVEAAARAALARLGADETLVLVDVANATPCNGVRRLLADSGLHLRVVAGANVPMLWRALCYRKLPLEDVLRRAVDGATMGVLPLSPSRPQQQALKPGADDQLPNNDQQ